MNFDSAYRCDIVSLSKTYGEVAKSSKMSINSKISNKRDFSYCEIKLKNNKDKTVRTNEAITLQKQTVVDMDVLTRNLPDQPIEDFGEEDLKGKYTQDRDWHWIYDPFIARDQNGTIVST